MEEHMNQILNQEHLPPYLLAQEYIHKDHQSPQESQEELQKYFHQKLY